MNLDLNENELTVMGIKFDILKILKVAAIPLVQTSLNDGYLHPTMLSMNQYKNKKGSIYTILKNFWKVILEDREDKVNSTKTFYSRSFKHFVTRKEVLDYILAIDAEFTSSYERVHEIREAIKAKNSVELEKYIDIDTRRLSKAINTMKKHKEYILNAIKYEYSNGSLEGFNNKIKLLKRVSYGYFSFSNFRLRILIMSRLFVSEYKNNIKLKENKKKSKQQNAA